MNFHPGFYNNKPAIRTYNNRGSRGRGSRDQNNNNYSNRSIIIYYF